MIHSRTRFPSRSFTLAECAKPVKTRFFLNMEPLINFRVVAIHRKTGKVQFATIPAPSQQDADDFVSDAQPDWIVIRGEK